MTNQKVEKERGKGQERLLLFLFALSIIIMTMVADQSIGTSAPEAEGDPQTVTLVPTPIEHTDW
ncbi:hypothetical protein HUG15_12135 [Salicibibacter cibarius]|uniref:Uncharacterized protein n=1 Tax=Salicibibacter cibarius TaxID=2743000 RepID=A0A7T7CBS1_9BACI|nr:hypothetical protein [Salicibibacter cibarius]QQK76232.1 hypothetical protein HUG15_12135 [Salicibibacter cibarius]